jgi:hydrogenase maturation protease
MTRADDAAATLRDQVAPERQIVIAAIGADWASDETTAAAVAAALGAHELPSGVSLHELGTGALDIAYDVMRGYDALVLIDLSADGADRGVTEADEKAIDPTIEDGQEVNHLAMDLPTVLHFITHVGGWPGKVVVVPCAPGGGEAAAGAAVDQLFGTVAEIQDA